MQQWEYKTLISEWNDANPRVINVDGRSLASGEQQYLEAALAEAGLEGWELTGIEAGRFSSLYVFKRPKP